MDIFFSKPLKKIVVACSTSLYNKDLYNKEGMGNKFERKKCRKNSVARDEKNIAPIIKFIGSYRLPFEKV
jgi:hypothetical protein